MLRISIIQLLPSPGNMRPDRRHRHLGPSAGDHGGEDDPEWSLLTGKGRAGEHEPEGVAGALHPCGDTGVGWFEAEIVPSFEGVDPLGEAASQRKKALRVAIGGDVSPEAPRSLRGQRCRYEHPLRLEIEGRVRIPVKLSETPGKIRRPAPLLGEHTEETLMGLGYSKEEIADLRERRVI
jgi:hypothetical protein